MIPELHLHQNHALNHGTVEYHIRELLKIIGENVDREGLLQTPGRVAKMFEEIYSGYGQDPHNVFNTTFNESYDELVIVRDITYYSQCEHHMVPFFGTINIGYLPDGKLVGLSKFARLADAITRKLQVQERITNDIAQVIDDVLQPKGVIVVVTGEHLCMCSRGVKKSGSRTLTVSCRGEFQTDSKKKDEFFALLKN